MKAIHHGEVRLHTHPERRPSESANTPGQASECLSMARPMDAWDISSTQNIPKIRERKPTSDWIHPRSATEQTNQSRRARGSANQTSWEIIILSILTNVREIDANQKRKDRSPRHDGKPPQALFCVGGTKRARDRGRHLDNAESIRPDEESEDSTQLLLEGKTQSSSSANPAVQGREDRNGNKRGISRRVTDRPDPSAARNIRKVDE